MEKQRSSSAMLILVAGILFNLSIGVLYGWSVIKKQLTAAVEVGGWGWSSGDAGLPYTVAIVFFAIGLLIGGRMQDKIGPRKVVILGGILVGGGMIASSFVTSVIGIAISFGVITGTGIGFGYGCVTPAALKWFAPTKKGLISGLIVGGFGMAAVFYAPLMNALVQNPAIGISKTFLYVGLAVTVISVFVGQFIKNPPAGYNPCGAAVVSAANCNTVNFNWKQMVKTKQFYLLFMMFFFSSSVGLMVIGNVTRIASLQVGLADAAWMVSLLAIFNTLGRVLGGILSDKIGRVNTMVVVFVLQGLNMVAFASFASVNTLLIGVAVVGLAYGALLSVFPSYVADAYGLKNYGMNYGIVYLAWGLSGVGAPVIADLIFDATQSFNNAYVVSAVFMFFVTILAFVLKKAKLPEQPAE